MKMFDFNTFNIILKLDDNKCDTSTLQYLCIKRSAGLYIQKAYLIFLSTLMYLTYTYKKYTYLIFYDSWGRGGGSLWGKGGGGGRNASCRPTHALLLPCSQKTSRLRVQQKQQKRSWEDMRGYRGIKYTLFIFCYFFWVSQNTVGSKVKVRRHPARGSQPHRKSKRNEREMISRSLFSSDWKHLKWF